MRYAVTLGLVREFADLREAEKFCADNLDDVFSVYDVSSVLDADKLAQTHWNSVEAQKQEARIKLDKAGISAYDLQILGYRRA